jgi:drug/metabolite transporter (DMT)-like permease
MMYVWIAIFAYLLLAVNGVIDKFLLTKAVRHPVVYAFYLGITGPLTFLLAPFGLKLISLPNFLIAVASGACFIFAAYFLYIATLETSISRLLPIEGGFVPVLTLILSYAILGERLNQSQILAFIFLVVGAALISFKKEAGGWHPKALKNATAAAILFALSLTLTKYIFTETNFVSGLIWTRVGFLAVSLGFLVSRRTRRQILNAPRETTVGNKFLYYGARASGGAAGLLQNYAISLGSVTLVNALQGSQYAFLLLLTIFLSRYFPKILKEKISSLILIQKISAIVLITIGLILLTR